MQLIRAGLRDDVHGAAAIASVFGGKLRLQIEFLDCVDGKKGGRSTGNSHLVERRIVEPRVVVVRPVKHVIVRTVAIPVDIELSETLLSACDT
jgi:hypothetical protein